LRKQGPRAPVATYRLQLSGRFGFRDAESVVRYLGQLGVSDCYISPILKARRGSPHCYDVVDHASLNPEIGSREEFERFAGALKSQGMGLIVDIVPNHMAASCENAMWTSVLENGPSSPYAGFFDIDWSPPDKALEGRVLLPILTEGRPEALDRLGVELDNRAWSLSLRVGGGERVPLTPGSYQLVLGELVPDLGAAATKGVCRVGERLKRRLADRCSGDPRFRASVASAVGGFNSRDRPAERAARFSTLLEAQFYLLAHWREASSRINYRRFLLVNDLVALRAERPEVFEESHGLVLDLVAGGWITGLRIDHCDGLADPAGYFTRLARACARRMGGPPYIITEKILGRDEALPSGWAVGGTTGYDFARDSTALLVKGGSGGEFSSIYRTFTGRRRGIDEVEVEARRLATERMGSELDVLIATLGRISKVLGRQVASREARKALVEVIAHFPVYRTYAASGTRSVGVRDSRYVREAVEGARGASPPALRLIEDVLLLRPLGHARGEAKELVEKFQHATVQAAVAGVEDTAFYRYNRLASLNEVGGDPGSFGISAVEFHRRIQRRARSWPHSMLATSTHDTKRSEDVRARINALSEVPGEWGWAVSRWARLNLPNKSAVEERLAPSSNDEYLFYQTLVGAWPLSPLTGSTRPAFVERMASYMTKAAREAKEETSWTDPNPGYEDALDRFVRAALEPGNPFLNAFEEFEEGVAYSGMLCSLSQLLLKLTCPGVPDIYQGNEVWDYSLVDPDNRRDVDFSKLSRMLDALERRVRASGEDRRGLASGLLARWRDGTVKMYVTMSTLGYRSRHRELFERGAYVPIDSAGGLCAFSRELGEERCVVVLPTSFVRFPGSKSGARDPWRGARISLGDAGAEYRDIFTGRWVRDRGAGILARDALDGFPVALLVRERGSPFTSRPRRGGPLRP
jgi:malto-oligosyltrehalose synthase